MKKNSNRTIKYLVGIGIYVAIIVLIVIFGLMPKLSELSKNQNDLSKAKEELTNTTDKRSSLEQISKDKTRIDLVNNVTLEYLPQTPNTSDFIVKVEALAKQQNIVIGSFSFTEIKATPKTTSSDEDTSNTKNSSSSSTSTPAATKTQQSQQNSSEFTIIITAEYSQLLQFVEKMETFPRVNVVDSINLSGYNKDKNVITLKIVGRIFYGN